MKGIAVAVVGAYPPPVHGMAKNNEIIANDLSRDSRVIRIDTSGGELSRTVGYHFRRLARVAVGLTRIAVSRPQVIYAAVDAGGGD